MNRSKDDNGLPPDRADDDSALFRAAVGAVRPLPDDGRRAPDKPQPSTRPRRREADEAAVIAELVDGSVIEADMEIGDALVYRRPGVQNAVIRRLRRGHYRCEAEIDLHGMVVEVARRCLGAFLHEAIDNDYRCVRIVHGKGLRSGHRGPVLKRKVAGWLTRRDDVLAYASARTIDGGTGALFVLLRRRSP